MPKKFHRKRLWVDSSFQGRLLLRMGLYLLALSVVVSHTGFVFELPARLANNGLGKGIGALYLDYLATQKPLLCALVVTAPILLYNLLEFSHRIAGPLYRCRKVMDEMAAGKPVAEFTPRKGDFMGELFRSFNGLIRAWNARVAAGGNGHPGGANPTGFQTATNSWPPGEARAPEAQRLSV